MTRLQHRQSSSPLSSPPFASAARLAIPRRTSRASSVPAAWLVALGAFGVAITATGFASAVAAPAEPSCDLDCPQGTTCELAPVACPAIFCADDAPDCPRCDDHSVPYCAPADCQDDGGCGAGMRCAEQTVFSCPTEAPTSAAGAGAGAGSDTHAELPAPPECAPSVFHQCTPSWQLPCTTDTDCGAGFRCEESESCESPPYDPTARESAAAAPSAEVTCRPSGTFACVVVETACASDADCLADFACAENPNGSCSSSSDGETRCEPADPARLCLPRASVSPPATGGDTPTAEAGSVQLATDTGSNPEASASEGGCSMNGSSSPKSVFALISTLGLAAAFGVRRRGARS
jgi:hypothetical protein